MDLTRDQHMFSLKTLVTFFTLLCGHCSHGKLEIRRMDSPVKLHPGDNTTLPCLFYGYEDFPLVLSIVSVRWTLRTSEGEEKPVYWYNGRDHNQTRPGSRVPDSGLMVGDGSLYIPNIQPSDEGEYTCTVIVTPEKAISKVTMEVSAKPNCTLSDSRLEMTPDTERSVACYAKGFHPQAVTIHWVKYSKATSNKSQLDSQTWIRIPAQNPDGTYNVTSLLTVRPMSTDEDGDVYSCVVTHRSLEDAHSLNFTLSVQPIKDIRAPYIIGIITAILLTMAVVIIIIAGLYFIYKYVPLQVSQITGDARNRILVCHIFGFRPRKLNLNLYYKEGSGSENIYVSWSPDTTQEKDNEQMMPLRPKNDRTGLYLEPFITSDKWFFFSCVCTIRISPQFHMKNEDKIILQVDHGALKFPFCRYQQQIVKRNFCPPDVCNGNR